MEGSSSRAGGEKRAAVRLGGDHRGPGSKILGGKGPARTHRIHRKMMDDKAGKAAAGAANRNSNSGGPGRGGGPARAVEPARHERRSVASVQARHTLTVGIGRSGTIDRLENGIIGRLGLLGKTDRPTPAVCVRRRQGPQARRGGRSRWQALRIKRPGEEGAPPRHSRAKCLVERWCGSPESCLKNQWLDFGVREADIAHRGRVLVRFVRRALPATAANPARSSVCSKTNLGRGGLFGEAETGRRRRRAPTWMDQESKISPPEERKKEVLVDPDGSRASGLFAPDRRRICSGAGLVRRRD